MHNICTFAENVELNYPMTADFIDFDYSEQPQLFTKDLTDLPAREEAEAAYTDIISSITKTDVTDISQVVKLCLYFGITVEAPSTVVTGAILSRLDSETSVHQLFAVKAAGDCRRIIKIIQDMKGKIPLMQAHDITIDGVATQYTSWSVNQVNTWAKDHGLDTIIPILTKHAIAGDVLADIDFDELFALSNFPVDLQTKFKDELSTLRGSSLF